MMTQPKFGIHPDKFYGEPDLDKLGKELGLPQSRSQRDRLRRQRLFPRPVKLTPGRNATLGQDLIDHIERAIAAAHAA